MRGSRSMSTTSGRTCIRISSARGVDDSQIQTALNGMCEAKPWASRSWHTPGGGRRRLSISQLSRLRGAHAIQRCVRISRRSWLIVAILCAGCGGTSNTPGTPASQHEGALTLYTTIAEKDLPTLIQPFESKYGIKVTVWRAGTDRVLQRTTAEAAAGRHDVDVIHFGSPEMEALAREQILLTIAVPVHADLQPGPVPANGQWAAALLSVWAQAWHPWVRARDELRRWYSDLLGAKWKGRLGMEAKDQDWFGAVVDVMGSGDKGLGFFHGLAARNGVSVRLAP